jgi:hypothetical protein
LRIGIEFITRIIFDAGHFFPFISSDLGLGFQKAKLIKKTRGEEENLSLVHLKTILTKRIILKINRRINELKMRGKCLTCREAGGDELGEGHGQVSISEKRRII